MALFNDQYNEFQYLKDWADTSFLVQLDIKEKSLSVYTSPIHLYDLATEPLRYTEGGVDYLRWTFLDKDASRGHFKVMLPAKDSKDENHYLLYIIYSNVTYVYRAFIP